MSAALWKGWFQTLWVTLRNQFSSLRSCYPASINFCALVSHIGSSLPARHADFLSRPTHQLSDCGVETCNEFDESPSFFHLCIASFFISLGAGLLSNARVTLISNYDFIDCYRKPDSGSPEKAHIWTSATSLLLLTLISMATRKTRNAPVAVPAPIILSSTAAGHLRLPLQPHPGRRIGSGTMAHGCYPNLDIRINYRNPLWAPFMATAEQHPFQATLSRCNLDHASRSRTAVSVQPARMLSSGFSRVHQLSDLPGPAA